MLLLGHRGARRTAPENTLAAFEKALADGCDGFEFDVRATADAVPVVCHDPDIAGLTVSGSSQAQLAARCPSLPALNTVLAQFASRAYLYFELKVTGVEATVLSLLAAHKPQQGYVVASFLPEAIENVHALDQTIPLGLICDRSDRLALWRSLPISILMPHYRLAVPELLQEAHAAGKQVFAWTVNGAKEMQTLAEAGIDGLVSDDTELLGKLFRRG
jgi:glycerophosphoryl diester phosphodiesterase